MSFAEGEITLYHSTDSLSLQKTKAVQILFGREWLVPTGVSSSGSNLTPDKKASQRFIVSHRGEGQWITRDGAPDLYTLTFRLPRKLVKKVGTTHLFGCEEYATLLTTDAHYIPESYFQRLHAGTGIYAIAKAKAIALQENGKIRFYEVPLEFLIETGPVHYTYKGINYPRG